MSNPFAAATRALRRPLFWRRWGVLVGVFVASFVVIAAGVPHRPAALEGDEGFLLAGRSVFRHMVLEPDWSSSYWRERDNNYGSPNPRVGTLILGFLEHLTTVPLPDPADTRRIAWIRYEMSAIAAAVAAALFHLARLWWKTAAAGLLAAALLLAHPVFRSVQSALLPEIPMALFGLFALSALENYASRPSIDRKPRSWIIGLWLGLAVSCRLYAVCLVAPIMWRLYVREQRPLSMRVLDIALVAAAAAAVFVLSNPLMTSDPGFALREMTTQHYEALGESPVDAVEVPPVTIFLTPFLGFRSAPFDLLSMTRDPYMFEPSALDRGLIKVFLTLAALGLWRVLRHRRHEAPVFFGAAYALVAYVMLSMNLPWIVAKVFLWPVIALVLVQCGVAGRWRNLGATDADAP